jgi:PAS domain S-box-containing protein
MDVTEHELLTQELRRRQAYLDETQRLNQKGSFRWKVSSGELFWSDETFQIFQCEARTKPTVEFALSRVHPQDRNLVELQIERASRDRQGFDIEHRLRLPDRCIKYVRVSARPSLASSGDFEFVGTVTDVSEQRQVEALIRDKELRLFAGLHLDSATQQQPHIEAQLQSTLNVIPAYTWYAAPSGALVFVNERTADYLGLPKDHALRFGIDIGGEWDSHIPLLHPDDQEESRRVWETCLRTGRAGEFSQRVRNAEGAYRWFLSRAEPLRASDGTLLYWVGVNLDIEGRKQAEQKLQAQEMELRQMLDLTPQLVGVFGPNRERLYANRIMLDYLGLSLDEWRQRSPGSDLHPDDSERHLAARDRALSTGSLDEVELRARKADGSYRWFLVRFNPVRDDKGKVMRWYVASTDIEDRKRAEEKLRQENAALREEIDQASMFEEIVGTSQALKCVLSHISKVAPSDSTVLITGETGTGKELVARAIHRRSARASRAFVSVNCAAIPRELIASELFGHEKGAFTGATQRRIGRFELADGGTIFLDEVGELLPDTQVALLRMLQEREFERLGGNQTIHVDVRVVTATNRNLEAAVSNGSFRQDLLYRLNVFPIEVPPLRERKDDILMLVEYFVQRYASRAGKNIRSIDKKTVDLLHYYEWPGNIRELQNVIERSVILCSSEVFSVDESWLSKGSSGAASRVQTPALLNVDAEPRSEREIIEAALAASRGRVSGPSGAAARLGIPPSTLDHRIKALKIDKTKFKFC